ncbi:M28 family peptidase [Tengunoibacter tsumagoiensis]|uniref:PKD domain-containing protein n=1 Tax=Tengunoibacter tsumagoiensis TaxID=2014871 RepID=A0A401ZY49_9CHLR|nr:M28 family peptidase [Tengunoibacter tsumagoiensis]GCE11771.1 hypothetical protein KTT_16300 [Tengunoibacter tsumagoiensis]
MRSRLTQLCVILLLAISINLTALNLPHSSASSARPLHNALPIRSSQHMQTQLEDFPAVDPQYIYDQLSYMATHFLKREAGYDTNLPPEQNGHDEFAAYWAQEMMTQLKDFGAQTRKEAFPIQGWINRSPATQAFNEEVTIPGASHPEQVVVIGCHYDGMAFSTQSANDDASGCAIELGVAKALNSYWQTHHVYPARTLRFVIFDCEEQGLYGSYNYVNTTVNGDLSNIVAMFNEEQSGIAYPLRYLGQLKNDQLPLYLDISPTTNTDIYPQQSALTAQQKTNMTHFHDLMKQAILPVFQQFRALGYAQLTYHDTTQHKDVKQQIFTPEQANKLIVEDDTLGSSDQVPFTQAGIPSATFAGNSTYYDKNAPTASYPYDQPGDTIELMNTFADGSSKKSNALLLALGLPGMLTTWMLHQPDILGQVQSATIPQGTPLISMSDIGQTQVNQALNLNAHAAFVPGNTAATPSFSWDFGDGTKATGAEVTHTYTQTGTYTITVQATTPEGAAHTSKTISITTQSQTYDNMYANYRSSGKPRANPIVTLPSPDDTLTDAVFAEPDSQQTVTHSHLPAAQKDSMIPTLPLLVALTAVIVLGLIGVGALAWRKRRVKAK